ncbi:MAG: PilZ domain-containing protein [Desulfobacter sp.]|nr:MAG: PilZ domain-containing protein [Desulfobacter sp.]
MELLNSILSSMGPVSKLLSAAIFLTILILIFRTIWISYQRGKDPKKNIVKDIYVVSIQNKNPFDDAPSSKNYKISTIHAKGKEKRKFPRYNVESQVEFIKNGKLFKETSKDLSYTGIFLNSKMPDRYKVGDKVMLTFQLPKEGPKKRNGFIVRKNNSGIGIHFVF